ncbi:MAG: hypothetical protein ABSD20_11385 [Terriglobales bacterium]
MRIRRLFLLTLTACAIAFGEGTRIWQQSSFDEFEKGTARGVAISSDGRLELAPAFKAITTTPSTYIWDIAADQDGNIFLAAGAPARVYRVSPDGKSIVVFEPPELQVQSLVVESGNVIYAATSPDGKVYKIERNSPEHLAAKSGKKKTSTVTTGQNADAVEKGSDTTERARQGIDPEWSSSEFYDPKTKYIWAMARDAEGALYIATGDHGEIFKVDRHGEGALWMKSDEAHIRALAFDAQGNLIAGSDGSGLVDRISPKGETFVLYSAPKKEITALAIDDKGNIYAAATGEKRTGETFPSAGATLTLNSTGGSAAPKEQTPGANPGITLSVPLMAQPGQGAGGSEVYQIAVDGSPKRIWMSREDLVYALGFDSQGRLLAGTGNKGRIFSIRSEQQFTDLVKASATQVTGFAKAPNGGMYVATSNLGKVFLLGGVPDVEGTFQSDVFDARIFSRWGRAQVRGSGSYELWARSGNVDNPDRNWSPWISVDLSKDEALGVPSARFVQWKVVLRPGSPPAQISSVLLNFLPKNVAPVIDDVTVQAGVRYPSLPKSGSGEGFTLSLESQPPVIRADIPPPSTHDQQSIGVRWTAHDPNDDQMVYSLYYRGDGETRWKLLKDRITDKFYSFDAALLPDGGYTVKVVASDAPSNSPDAALTTERESPHFDVDTMPPSVEELHAAVESGLVHITFRATDGYSDIKRAEYSVDAGEWQFVEPVGRISDSRTENYDFSVPEPGAEKPAEDESAAKARQKLKKKSTEAGGPAGNAEHVIVVRVWDRFDNVASAKTVIHSK